MEKIPKLIKPLRTAYEAKTEGINKNNKKEINKLTFLPPP